MNYILIGISLSALIISVLATILQYFIQYSSVRERLVKLETKMEVIWGVIEKEMAGILRGNPGGRIDDYLDKFLKRESSSYDLEELKLLLAERIEREEGHIKFGLIFLLALVESELSIIREGVATETQRAGRFFRKFF